MSRLTQLRTKMNELGVDAVLVLNELNQHYLAEFAFTDGFLLVAKDKAYLVTDFRYYEMAIKGASKDFEILMPENRREFIDRALTEDGVKTIGFEGGFVSYETYRAYCDRHPDFTFVNIGDMIDALITADTAEKLKGTEN